MSKLRAVALVLTSICSACSSSTASDTAGQRMPSVQPVSFPFVTSSYYDLRMARAFEEGFASVIAGRGFRVETAVDNGLLAKKGERYEAALKEILRVSAGVGADSLVTLLITDIDTSKVSVPAKGGSSAYVGTDSSGNVYGAGGSSYRGAYDYSVGGASATATIAETKSGKIVWRGSTRIDGDKDASWKDIIHAAGRALAFQALKDGAIVVPHR